jgi:hypothetical protein
LSERMALARTILRLVCSLCPDSWPFADCVEEFEHLFRDFEIVENRYVMKTVENKKEEKKMDRIWIQGKFKK